MLGLVYVWVATLANLPIARVLSSELSALNVEPNAEVYLSGRVLREAVLLILGAALVAHVATTSGRLLVPSARVWWLALPTLWAVTATVYSLVWLDVAPLVVLWGLRILLPVPFVAAGYLLARHRPAGALTALTSLTGPIRWYVWFLLAATLAEAGLRLAHEPSGVVTARYAATFSNPNNLGAMTVACALWLLCATPTGPERDARSPAAIVTCIILAVASGSRAAITLTAAVAWLWAVHRRPSRWTPVWYAALPLVMAGVLWLASDPTIARRQTTRSNATRLNAANRALSSMDSMPKVLLGSGIGRSSAPSRLLGEAANDRSVPNAHSVYVEAAASFGVVGLAILLALFTLPLLMRPAPATLAFVLVAGLIGVTLPIWRMPVAGALLGLLWGHLLALPPRRRLGDVRPPDVE